MLPRLGSLMCLKVFGIWGTGTSKRLDSATLFHGCAGNLDHTYIKSRSAKGSRIILNFQFHGHFSFKLQRFYFNKLLPEFSSNWMINCDIFYKDPTMFHISLLQGNVCFIYPESLSVVLLESLCWAPPSSSSHELNQRQTTHLKNTVAISDYLFKLTALMR